MDKKHTRKTVFHTFSLIITVMKNWTSLVEICHKQCFILFSCRLHIHLRNRFHSWCKHFMKKRRRWYETLMKDENIIRGSYRFHTCLIAISKMSKVRYSGQVSFMNSSYFITNSYVFSGGTKASWENVMRMLWTNIFSINITSSL